MAVDQKQLGRIEAEFATRDYQSKQELSNLREIEIEDPLADPEKAASKAARSHISSPKETVLSGTEALVEGECGTLVHLRCRADGSWYILEVSEDVSA